jgi:Leucine-rich repeat (LRR) protein
MAGIKRVQISMCLMLLLTCCCIRPEAKDDFFTSDFPIDTVTAYGLARTSVRGNRVLRVSVNDNENMAGESYYIWGEEGGISIPSQIPIIAGYVILAYPDVFACTSLNVTNHAGRKRPFVLLVQRGRCSFLQKSVISKLAGAVAMYVYMCKDCYPTFNAYHTVTMTIDLGQQKLTDIPGFFINTNDARDILTSLSKNNSLRIGVNGYTTLANADREILETMWVSLYPNKELVSPSAWCVPTGTVGYPDILCDRDRVVSIRFRERFSWYTTATTTTLGWNVPSAISLLSALASVEVRNIPLHSFPSLEDSTIRFLTMTNVTAVVPVELLMKLPAHLVTFTCIACMIRDVPSILSHARNLTYLDLSWGQLTGQLTRAISLPYLLVCILNQNVLTGTIAWLSTSLHIEIVDISKNKLSDIAEDTFDGLAHLSHLTVDHNEFQSPLPSFLGCTSLTRFSFAYNYFMGAIPESWSEQELPLAHLQCSYNQVWINASLRLPKLTYIDMSYNALHRCPRVDFDYIIGYLICINTEVETVILAGNRIISPPSIDSGYIGVCVALKVIDLSHNLIDVGRWDQFKKIPVVDLDMSYNLLTGTLPAVLQVSLRRLDLVGNPTMQGDLPGWLTRDPAHERLYPPGNVTTGYVCHDTVGTTAQVTIDPDYTNFESCHCLQGSYGLAPDCLAIPTQLAVPALNNIVRVRDDTYGTRRSREGMSITWKMTVPPNISQTICVWSTDVHFLHDWSSRDTLVVVSRANHINESVIMFGVGNFANTTTHIVLFGCDVYVTFTSTNKNGVHVLVEGTLASACPAYMKQLADGCIWIDNRITYYLILGACIVIIISGAFLLVKYRVGAALPIMYKHSKEYIHIVLSFLTEIIDSITDTITFASVTDDSTLANFHMPYIICFSLAMVASLVKVGSLLYGFYSWLNAVDHANKNYETDKRMYDEAYRRKYDQAVKQKYAHRRLTRLYVKCLLIMCEGLPMTIINLYITFYIKMTRLIILSMMWSILLLGAHIHAISGIPILLMQSRVSVVDFPNNEEDQQEPRTNALSPAIDSVPPLTNLADQNRIQCRHF